MGDGLYERLVREHDYRCRIYAPVGGHKDLLAYLVRRLLENGANSSFVHQLADEHKSDEELLADPVEKVKAVGGTRSEEHTSELQSLMRISYAVFCLKKKKKYHTTHIINQK